MLDFMQFFCSFYVLCFLQLTGPAAQKDFRIVVSSLAKSVLFCTKTSKKPGNPLRFLPPLADPQLTLWRPSKDPTETYPHRQCGGTVIAMC